MQLTNSFWESLEKCSSSEQKNTSFLSIGVDVLCTQDETHDEKATMVVLLKMISWKPLQHLNENGKDKIDFVFNTIDIKRWKEI